MADTDDDKPKKEPSSEDEDILEEAKKEYDRAVEAEEHNRTPAIEDIKFVRLRQQWNEDILKTREGLPCLVIPILEPVIRQVVNDCRQNKPQIKVSPVDSGSDPETAEIYSDLIRNIEQQSRADIAYDTAVDCAVTSSWGYIRIGLDYAHDDTFDQDISIDRVLDPLSVYGDPDSISADGSNWNRAFVVDRIPKDQFEAKYGDAGKVDWDAAGYSSLKDNWFNNEGVLVAEYWKRVEVEKDICLLSDGSVISKAQLEMATDGIPYQDFLQSEGITIEQERKARSWKVTQYILTGAEVISTREWPGKYIPIVPVYGDETFSEGKRYLSSLTRAAQDAQRNFNYWRSYATQLMALAPKVPWVGPEGFTAADPNWARANDPTIPFLQVALIGGQYIPPTRDRMDVGAAAGALQEAMSASDDVKRITGIYDASLGARSNETSGVAINARKKEGDVSTFHFIDNLNRAISFTGRILIDLIPHVYNKKRMIRVLGEDDKARMVPLKQPVPIKDEEGRPKLQMGMNGRPLLDPAGRVIPVTRINDLAIGKYDVVVKAGPSYTTRREEAATQLTEALRSVPMAATVLVPEIFKNLDIEGAEDIARKLEALAPNPNKGPPPEVMQKQMAQAKEAFGKLNQEKAGLEKQLQQLTMKAQAAEMDKSGERMQAQVDAMKMKIEAFRAETERAKVMNEARFNWAELGLDAQLGMADFQVAHNEAQMHGLESGGSSSAGPGAAGIPGMGTQPPPQPPMGGPQQMQPPPMMSPGPMPNGPMPGGM